MDMFAQRNAFASPNSINYQETQQEPKGPPPGMVEQMRNIENGEILQQYMPLRQRRDIEPQATVSQMNTVPHRGEAMASLAPQTSIQQPS